MIMACGNDSEIENIIRNHFREYHGDKVGEDIYQLYSGCLKNKYYQPKDNRNHAVDYLNNLMSNLEKEFLNWQNR